MSEWRDMEGAPNYWHDKDHGVCIRPDYQQNHQWCSLPPEPPQSSKEIGDE